MSASGAPGPVRVGGTHRAWVFTLNNPTAAEQAVIDALVEDRRAVFTAYQLEQGEAGTPHFQGYVIFADPRRLNWCRNTVSDRAHWEPRRGLHEQALDYATKADTRVDGPWIHGMDEVLLVDVWDGVRGHWVTEYWLDGGVIAVGPCDTDEINASDIDLTETASTCTVEVGGDDESYGDALTGGSYDDPMVIDE